MSWLGAQIESADWIVWIVNYSDNPYQRESCERDKPIQRAIWVEAQIKRPYWLAQLSIY